VGRESRDVWIARGDQDANKGLAADPQTLVGDFQKAEATFATFPKNVSFLAYFV